MKNFYYDLQIWPPLVSNCLALLVWELFGMTLSAIYLGVIAAENCLCLVFLAPFYNGFQLFLKKLTVCEEVLCYEELSSYDQFFF